MEKYSMDIGLQPPKGFNTGPSVIKPPQGFNGPRRGNSTSNYLGERQKYLQERNKSSRQSTGSYPPTEESYLGLSKQNKAAIRRSQINTSMIQSQLQGLQPRSSIFNTPPPSPIPSQMGGTKRSSRKSKTKSKSKNMKKSQSKKSTNKTHKNMKKMSGGGK
jgi:hypothetical protein